jgi:hypothetical protein
MARNAESVIVRADMSALEYHEAAWVASDREAAPPDPATLSDRALYVVLRYEAQDLLPSEAQEAVDAECRRRGLVPDTVDRLIAITFMAVLGLSGLVIGWILFSG